MRILIAHNFYQQPGGEDTVVYAEASMLKARGHVVEIYGRDNLDINLMPLLNLVGQTFWSKQTTKDIVGIISNFKPDIIHTHNIFPLISPSIYWAAAKANVPVVQTLHNFRLLCPQAMFLRDSKVCEDCLGHIPWRGAFYGCYRGSKSQTAVLAGMISVHNLVGTWHNKVTCYIALNEFCRKKFIEGGLPEERIVVKPNFVDFSDFSEVSRQGFLFAGRLSVEKGVKTLADAAQLLNGFSIRVAGIGPQSDLLNNIAGLQLLGAISSKDLRTEMINATALVLPSIWYENFPRTLVEAFSCGLPVVASRIGALAELVDDGFTGLLFEPGNSEDLASKLNWALLNPEKMQLMGQNAFKKYEAEYSSTKNYEQLMVIYQNVKNHAKLSQIPGGKRH